MTTSLTGAEAADRLWRWRQSAIGCGMRILRNLPCLVVAMLVAACIPATPEMTTYRAPYEPGGEARNAERFAWLVPNQIEMTSARPVSVFSLDVDTAAYAVARRYINNKTLPPVQSVKSAEFLNYFDYGYDGPETSATPFKITAVIAPNPWNPDTRLLHLGLRAYDVPLRPPLKIVLAVDTSDRMKEADRLPLIQAAADSIAASLRDGDQIAIVGFGGDPSLVLPPTAGSDRSLIKVAISQLAPHGRTNGTLGLDLAYRTAAKMFERSAANLVVLVTGGEFEDLNTRPFRALPTLVKEQRDNGIGLKVLGVGSQTLNGWMLQELSTASRSKASYADSPKEAARFFTTELGRQRAIVAHDVLANIEFNPAHVAEYRLIGYEIGQQSSGSQRQLSPPGADIGSGQETTILYEMIPPESPARRIKPLRYTKPATSQPDPRYSDEVAYVRIDYKLPENSRRQSMVYVVTPRNERHEIGTVPSVSRFAMAVAAYAEKLRNDGYIGDDFSFKQIARLALDSNLPDRLGQRTEFIDLVMRASVLVCASSRQLSADCR